MDSEKDDKPEAEETPKDVSQPDTPQPVQQTPADALSRTPEDLEKEAAEEAASEVDAEEEAAKKLSPVKRFFRSVNVYFLGFALVMVVASAITIVNYLNSQKAPVVPDVASQELTEDALRQLANTDTSVGSSSQTLTIQGNAVIAGETLMRGDLNVAGSFQTGGTIQGPTLTISGTSNLGEAQVNTLQVATNAAVQGTTTLGDLNVAGASTFGGVLTASQITASKLVMSGNATLEIPNHIGVTGPTPRISSDSNALGNGGSAAMSGSDTAGTITIRTGNSPNAGCFVRITFHQAFSNQPRVIITPIGSSAGQTQYYVDRDTNGFSVCTAAPAPANQNFGFDYFIVN